MDKIAAKIVDIKLQLKANTDAETYEIVTELLYEIYKIASEGKETPDESGNCIKPDVSGMVCEKNLQTHNCFAHENMIKGCLECPHFIKQTYH